MSQALKHHPSCTDSTGLVNEGGIHTNVLYGQLADGSRVTEIHICLQMVFTTS